MWYPASLVTLFMAGALGTPSAHGRAGPAPLVARHPHPGPLPPVPNCSAVPPAEMAGGSHVRVHVLQHKVTIFDYNETLGGGHGGHAKAFVNSGEIQAVVSYAGSRAKRSRDGGRSWYSLGTSGNRSLSEFDQRACELPSGEVIQFSGLDATGGQTFATVPSPAGSGFAQTVSAQLLRSHDDGMHQIQETAVIELPAGLQIVRMTHSNIIQLPVGNTTVLLSQFYGHLPNVDGDGKYRVVAIRSDTMGKSWYFTSTVAWDAVSTASKVGPSHELHPEGFDEASLVVTDLSSNLIACFMRTGKALYRSLSDTLGSSWSTADPIAPQGVAPVAVRTLHSGVIAVVYGRPGNYLRLSTDGARSFTGEWCFFNQTHNPYDGAQYDAVVPIPGTDDLLLVYLLCIIYIRYIHRFTYKFYIQISHIYYTEQVQRLAWHVRVSSVWDHNQRSDQRQQID